MAATTAPAEFHGNLREQEPLRSLADEFRFNAKFVGKVGQLERKGYCAWRRVRGDGNCFYRALGFGLLESIVTGDGPRRAEWAAALLARLAALQLHDGSERAAHAALMACVRGLFAAAGVLQQSQREPFDLLVDSAPEDLYRVMCNPQRPEDLALVRALRMLVAQFIAKHAHDDSLNGGISFQLIAESLGYAGAEAFCSSTVLPLGVEAEDMILPAVPQALGVGLRVALLHRSSGDDIVFCDYGLDSQDKSMPVIHLQLRPGHYDLLYQSVSANSAERVTPSPAPKDERPKPRESCDLDLFSSHLIQQASGAGVTLPISPSYPSARGSVPAPPSTSMGLPSCGAPIAPSGACADVPSYPRSRGHGSLKVPPSTSANLQSLLDPGRSGLGHPQPDTSASSRDSATLPSGCGSAGQGGLHGLSPPPPAAGATQPSRGAAPPATSANLGASASLPSSRVAGGYTGIVGPPATSTDARIQRASSSQAGPPGASAALPTNHWSRAYESRGAGSLQAHPSTRSEATSHPRGSHSLQAPPSTSVDAASCSSRARGAAAPPGAGAEMPSHPRGSHSLQAPPSTSADASLHSRARGSGGAPAPPGASAATPSHTRGTISHQAPPSTSADAAGYSSRASATLATSPSYSPSARGGAPAPSRSDASGHARPGGQGGSYAPPTSGAAAVSTHPSSGSTASPAGSAGTVGAGPPTLSGSSRLGRPQPAAASAAARVPATSQVLRDDGHSQAPPVSLRTVPRTSANLTARELPESPSRRLRVPVTVAEGGLSMPGTQKNL